MKIIVFSLIIFTFFISILIGNVEGHGLGGDQAPPINFAGMDVTVNTKLDPSDITAGELTKANMIIRFFDTMTDNNLDNVTYRVELWRSGELLARQLFYDEDGELNVEIRPKINCDEQELWRCTTYNGFKDPISGGLTAMGDGKPIISGPIFNKGGLYNIKVDIEGATSPKVQVAEPLSFETFVSVAQDQNFVIKNNDTSIETPITIKTYYDDIQSFEYDNSRYSISFNMPFNWDQNYIDLVQMVHEELRLPKEFKPYKETNGFKGYINGIEVDNRIIIADPYSYDDLNVVHFLVTGNELQRVKDKFTTYDANLIKFTIVPQKIKTENLLDVEIDGGALVKISWNEDNTISTDNNYIPIEFAFFDKQGNLLKDVRYGYNISYKNKELFSNVGNDPKNPGIIATEGIDIQKITIPDNGSYELSVAIFGIGMDYNQDYSGIGTGTFEMYAYPKLKTSKVVINTTQIPSWIKNNAGWWANGTINDEDFISGLEFMIKSNMIQIPPIDQSDSTNNVDQIPSWIKNNAGWWASGEIDDNEFINAVQYLVKQGIISL